MALPSSGAISLSEVNMELGKAATAAISMNDAAVRALAGKASGAISMADLRGKIYAATMVAGAGYSNGRNSRGFSIPGSSAGLTIGSLTELPWTPSQCYFLGSYQENGPYIEFAGNVISQLVGKKLEIDGVNFPMPGGTLFNGKTYWIRDSGTVWIPVEGRSYKIRIY